MWRHCSYTISKTHSAFQRGNIHAHSIQQKTYFDREEVITLKLRCITKSFAPSIGHPRKLHLCWPFWIRWVLRKLNVWNTLRACHLKNVSAYCTDNFFALCTDKGTDISNMYQWVSFLKCFNTDKSKVDTVFIERSSLLKHSLDASLNADAIGTCLTKKFQEVAMEIRNLKVFVWDGASVMKGTKGVVTAKLRKDFVSLMRNIHCICHDLKIYWRIVLKCKDFDTMSNKQQTKILKRVKKKGCRNCWLSLHAGFDVVFDKYEVIVKTIQEIQSDSSSGSLATGFLKNIKGRDFLATLYLLK